jgi:GNAT superfamily N-acetyltransferase
LFSQKSYAECIIAFENNEPIGFALFFHNFSTFVSKPGIYLEDLFVLESHRGKGYGKKLLLHVIALAKQRNCGRVDWSVLNWNKPAIDFYESLGATAMNEWTTYRLNEETINKLAN